MNYLSETRKLVLLLVGFYWVSTVAAQAPKKMLNLSAS